MDMSSQRLDRSRIGKPAGSVAMRLSVSIGVATSIAVVGWSSVAGRPLPDSPRPAYLASYARPTTIPYPRDNEYSAAREALGRRLFFDPMLSGSGEISCASCHNPALSWGDGRARAIGHTKKPLGRRTPTVLNVAWGELMMWDGRMDTLEAQALGPIQAPGEMNQKLEGLVANLRTAPQYRELFAEAYPGEPIDEITTAKAIATFERGIVSGSAAFDRWAAGDDRAMSAGAQRGFVVFNTTGRCATCHSSWRFSDDSFHDIGVAGKDLGRGAFQPSIEVMQHAFKTPTLRNVVGRSPYMHDGSVATLEDVIELYDTGGRAKRPSLSPEIKPLHLTSQNKEDLIAFLHALTSPDAASGAVTSPARAEGFRGLSDRIARTIF
jgi:cytochrome c peroxidase